MLRVTKYIHGITTMKPLTVRQVVVRRFDGNKPNRLDRATALCVFRLDWTGTRHVTRNRGLLMLLNYCQP